MSYNLDPKYDASKVIYINSRDATTYLDQNNFGDKMTTNFIINLKEKIICPSDQMTLVSLYSATIPHSFFNVRSGINDVIPIRILYNDGFGGAGAPQYYLQLDDGNYGTDELIDAVKGERGGFESDIYFGINDLILPSGQDTTGAAWTNEPLKNVIDFDMTYNVVNNCFRFDITYKPQNKVSAIALMFDWFSAAPTLLPSGLQFAGGYDTTKNADNMANAILGFRGDVDYPERPYQVYPTGDNPLGSIDYPPFCCAKNGYFAAAFNPQPWFDNRTTCQLQSQQVIDLNDNLHGLMLRTNLVSKGTLSTHTSIFSNILARIPITTINDTLVKQQGGLIYFDSNGATHQNLVDIRAVDAIGIKLTDDKDRVIDLNGLDWQLALLLQFVEKTATLQNSLSRKQIDAVINENRTEALAAQLPQKNSTKPIKIKQKSKSP